MGGFKYLIMNSLSVILISYKTKNLVDVAIRSFEKHKPEKLTLNYYIVETSNETSYMDFVEGLADNVKFLSYPEAEVKQKRIDPIGGSFANGYGIELGKSYVEDDYTFVCHSDVFVTSPEFFSELEGKVDEGYQLVGMSHDASRIQAAHQSGLLVSTEILKEINTLPQLPELDVGDALTQYCRDENIPYYVYPCTFNKTELNEVINEPYKSFGPTCGIDRTVDSSNNVMYMHLGRGTTKQQGRYFKPGKVTHDSWVSVCEELLK